MYTPGEVNYLMYDREHTTPAPLTTPVWILTVEDAGADPSTGVMILGVYADLEAAKRDAELDYAVITWKQLFSNYWYAEFNDNNILVLAEYPVKGPVSPVRYFEN